MNKDQLVSIGRGILKAVGAALAANGVDVSSTKKVVTGVVVALVGFVFSYLFHADDPTTTPPTAKTPGGSLSNQ